MAKQLNVNLAFNADTAKARQQIQELQKSLNDLVKHSIQNSSTGDMAITKQLTEAQVAASKLQTILTQSVNMKTGNLDLTKFSQSLDQSGLKLAALKNQLDLLGPSGQKAFVSLAQSIVTADVPLARTSKLLNEMWTTMKNTVRWQLSSSILHGVMGAYQSAMGYAKDLDQSLNNIRIVTGQGVDEMARFAEQANKAAKALSTTTTEYTKASLIYYQQGLNDTEVAKRTEVTVKMANAAGQSAQVVSDQLTAVWNNFYDGSKSLEYYADVMTALGAATASSTDEIAGGLNKFAAVGKTIGLSYEYAASALATITSNTRESEEVVGTALKTIFARIQGLNLGETLDDGTTLNKYSQALEKVGISIFEQTGEIKNMDKILDEMAAKWVTLNKDQQIALAQTVAGVRQYTQLVALMDNWNDGDSDSMIANLATSKNAEGTLQEQADIYAQSWEAARDRVKAATEDLFDSIIDEEFFITILDGFEDLLSGVANFTDAINGLPGILSLLGVVMSRVFSKQITESVNNLAFTVESLTGKTKKNANELQQQALEMAKNINFDTGTEAGDREGQAMQNRLDLQQQIKEISSNLTQEEQEQLVKLLEINDAYAEQAILAAKAKDAASQKTSEVSAEIRRKVSRNEGKDGAASMSDYKAQYTAMQELATHGAKAAESLNKVNSALKNKKDATGFGNEIEQVALHLERVNRPQGAANLRKLFDDFKSGKVSAEDFEVKLREVVVAEELLQDTSIAMSDGLYDVVKGSQVTQGECDALADRMIELAQATLTSDNANTAYQQSVVELKNSIAGFHGALDSFGTNVTKTMQGISSLAMAASSLKSAFDTLKNPDLSFGEKLLQVTMSLSMAIPALIAGLKALNAEQLKKNAADLKAIGVGAINLVQTGMRTAGAWGEAIANQGVTASLWQQVAAWIAVHIAALPVSVVILLIVAALAAFVAIVAGVVLAANAIADAYNADAIAAEKAETAAKNLASAYSDVKQEYDEMLSVMNRYESAREGLDSLAEGTQEYKEALDSANAAALELIRLGGLIKDQDYEITNGEIIIKEDSLKKAQNDKYAEMQSAYAASTMASANANKANAELEQTKLIRSNDTSTWDSAVHGIVGGFGAGMIAAMATGQIPLAIAGALAGGIIGAVNNQLRNDINNSIESKQFDDLVQRYDQIGEAAFDASELQKLGIDTANEEYIASLKKVVRETCQAADEIETAAELAATAILEQDDRFANSKDSAELYAASGEIYNQLYQDALKKYNDTNMTNVGIGTKEAKDLWDKYLQNSDLGNLRGIKATNFKADNTIDYEYYDSEGKKQQANIDLATMAAAVAAAEANDALAGSANTLLEVFNHLTKNGGEAAQALKDIIAYESVEDSTQNEFNALKTDFGALDDTGKYKYLHETFGGEDKQLSTEELKALGYDSIVTLKQGVEQAIAEGDKIWGSIGENLVGSAKTVFEKAFSDNIFEDFTAQQAQQVANMYQEVFGQGGTQAVSALDAVLRSSGDNADELSVILSAIDWQTTNVFDLSKMLKEAGIETDGFIDELAKLIDLMKEGQNTGFEAAAEHYTNMKDMAKLKEGDSITEEQYKQLEAAGIDASQYFKLMGDGSYELKEAAEEFYRLVNEKSLDVFKSNIEAIYQEVGSVDGVMRRRNEDTIADNNIGVSGGYNQELVSDQLTFLEALNIQLEDLDTYQQIVAEGGTMTREALQEIQTLVEENKGRWDELPASIQASAAELEKHQQALANSASTVDELNRLYEEQFITLEQYQEAVDEVMENEFEMEGLDPDAAEEVADAFRDMAEAGVEGMEALKNDEEAVKDATVRYMELNEAIEDIYDNYKDYTQVLKDVRKATSKADRAMAANTDSAKKLKVSMAGLLGTTEDMIDADFLATIDPKDFEAAANGNADAIERIRNQFIQLKAEMYGIDFASLKSELDAFNNGAYIDLNTTPFLNALIQAAINAGQTAAEIEAMLSGFGIDADVTPFTEELWQATQQAQAAGQNIANATSFTTEVEQTPVENTTTTELPQFTEAIDIGYKTADNYVTLGNGFQLAYFQSKYAVANKTVSSNVTPMETTEEKTVSGQTVTNGAGASGKGGVIVKNAHKAPAPSKAPGAGNTSRPPVSGGGGGGSNKTKEPSKPKKIDTTKQEEIVKRYKEIDDALDDLSDEYEKASRSADRLWGENRLDAIREQNKLIEEQQELLKEKQRQAENYMNQDRAALNKAAAEAGLSFSYDDKGNITNYTDQMTNLYNQLAAAEAHYNSLATGEDQEAYEETILEPLKDKIKAVEDAIEIYEESKELFEELGLDIEDLQDQIMQNNYDIIMEGLELHISFNEEDLENIDYYLSKLEDDFYSMAEAAALMVGANGNSQLNEYLSNLEEYGKVMDDLHKAYANGEITEAAYQEGLKEIRSNIRDNLSSLLELDKAMMEYYGETLAMAQEELAKYTNRMQQQTEVLQHYGNMMEILGKQLDYNSMGVILQGQVDTIENEMNVAEAAYNMYKQQAEEKRALYEEAMENNDLTAAELYKKEWEAAQEAADEAQSEMLSKTEEWAEAMRAVVENKLAGLAKSLEEALTGGTSFDQINLQLERAVSLQEEYLTTTNQIYETNKLMRTAQQAIDKSTNSVAKQRLKDFIKETDQLQDKAKLSQYELEIQQAKYNLLLAEIALEDAQNAKSTVRLQRDSEGNFGYVYTADQTQLAQAQQELEDAQNSLYNIGLEGAGNYTEKYTQTMQEMYDTLTSITEAYYNGEITSQEDYEAQMLAAQEYYYQQLENYQDLYGIALQTDTRVIQDSWTSSFRTMINNTENWKIKVNDYSIAAGQSLANWYSKVEEISQKTGLDNIANNVKKVTDESKALRDIVLGTDGEPGVINALQQELKEVSDLTRQYATFRTTLQGVITEYEKLINAANRLAEANARAGVNNSSNNSGSSSSNNSSNYSLSNSNNASSSNNTNDLSSSGESNSSSGRTQTANKYKATYNLRGRSNTISGYYSEDAARAAAESAINSAISALTGITFSEKNDIAAAARRSIQIARYNTGGYTGSWGPYGKLGILDEKELILNPEDTENFLASMKVLERILEIIDLQAVNSQLGGTLLTPSIGNSITSQSLEQSVHIEASFPGVQDRNEIEEAFNTLINKASQYANRK